jgi:hypothetical protein
MDKLPPLTKTPLDLTKGGWQGGPEHKYPPLQDFLQIHTPVVTADANGNGDDVFNAQHMDKTPLRHGDVPQDAQTAQYAQDNPDVVSAMLNLRGAVKDMWLQNWNLTNTLQSSRDADR